MLAARPRSRWRLRKAIDDDAVVVSGITNVGYWANVALEHRRPRTHLMASYFATPGFACPTALGAKVVLPDRAMISLSGDDGFMHALPELATAVQCGIDVGPSSSSTARSARRRTTRARAIREG